MATRKKKSAGRRKPSPKQKAASKKKATPKKKAASRKKATPKKKAASTKKPAAKRASARAAAKPSAAAQTPGSGIVYSDIRNALQASIVSRLL